MWMALCLPDGGTAGFPGHNAVVARRKVSIQVLPQSDHPQGLVGGQVGERTVVLGAVDEHITLAGGRHQGREVVWTNPRLRSRWDMPRLQVIAEWAVGRRFA